MRKILVVLFIICSFILLVSCATNTNPQNGDDTKVVLTSEEIEKLITFEGATIDYDGSTHSLSYTANLPDGYSVKVYHEGSDEVLEAGEYRFVLEVYYEEKMIYSKKAILEIKEKEYSVSVNANGGAYSVYLENRNNPITNLDKIADKAKLIFVVGSKEGFELDKVLVNNEEVVLQNKSFEYIVTKDSSIEIVWKQIVTYSVTVEADGGTYTITPQNIDLTKVKDGTTLHFVVDARDAFELDQVLVNQDPITHDNNEFDVIVDENLSITFVWEQNKIHEDTYYSVSVTCDPETGSVSSNLEAESVLEGTNLVITVSPLEGYKYNAIYINGKLANLALVDNKLSLTVDSDMAIIIEFVEATGTDITTPWIEG